MVHTIAHTIAVNRRCYWIIRESFANAMRRDYVRIHEIVVTFDCCDTCLAANVQTGLSANRAFY